MRREDYKRLGEYIVPYLEKNVGLKVTLSQGINNNKYFQTPRQVAVDSENDQIVRIGQFAYNKATTRNGEKISIAYREGPDCTVSSAYQVFYIKDEEKLNPHYLLMWFKRPEFDRYARFKSFGSAHEFFTWEEMCNVYLPIPSIEEQRKIVAEYQAVEQRIKNNNRLIKALEDTAQAIYHHTFVENIDPENLPEGWSYSNLKSITEFIIGGDWGKDQPEGNYTHKVLCIRGADTPSLKQCRIGVIPVRYILPKNLQSRKLIPGDVVVEISGGSPTQSTGRSAQMNLIADNYFGCDVICSNFCRVIRPMQPYSAFFYFAFNYMFKRDIFFKYENSSNGLKNLNLEAVLTDEKILIPSPDVSLNFSLTITSIQNSIYYIGQEQDKLNELLRLLLSKLS